MKQILLLLALPMCSCSLIFEAADISIRRSKEVSTSDQLTGYGFTLCPPEARLYPNYNHPFKGGVTLRPTDTARDGLVYYVQPFASATARTTDDAVREWNSIWEKKGIRVEMVEKSKSVFSGHDATRCIMRIHQRSGEHVSAFLVVRRDTDFLIIGHGNTRSFGRLQVDLFAAAKEDLGRLIRCTKLSSNPR